MNFIKLSLLIFWLLPINSLAQNQTGGISMGHYNVINGILNTGNFNRINQFQLNIKNPNQCQAKHFANYNKLNRKFQIAVVQYNPNKSSALQHLDSLLYLIENELNSLVACGLEKKLDELHPTFSCPYDYLERGDLLYGNLDFLNALLWYSDALKCITDKNIKDKIELKVKVCKKKIIAYEDFLNKEEFSDIDIVNIRKNGYISVYSKIISNNEFFTVLGANKDYRGAGYRIAYAAIIHDSNGKVNANYPLDEIEYEKTNEVNFKFLQNGKLMFYAQYYDSTFKLYLYDSLGKITRIKKIYSSVGARIIVNTLMIGISTEDNIICLDHDLNVLFEKKHFAGGPMNWANKNDTLTLSNIGWYRFSYDDSINDFNLQLYTIYYNFFDHRILFIPKDNTKFKHLLATKVDENLTLVTMYEADNNKDSVYEILMFNKSQLCNRYLVHNESYDSYPRCQTITVKDSVVIICRQWLDYKKELAGQIDSIFLSIRDNKNFGKRIQKKSHELNLFACNNENSYRRDETEESEWFDKTIKTIGKAKFITTRKGRGTISIPNLTLKKYYFKKNLKNPEQIKFFSGKQIKNSEKDTGFYWVYINSWDKWLKLYYNENGHNTIEIYNKLSDISPMASRNLPQNLSYYLPGYLYGDYSGTPCIVYYDRRKETDNFQWIQLIDSELNNRYNPIKVSLKIDSSNMYGKFEERIESVVDLGNYLVINSEYYWNITQRIYNFDGDLIDTTQFTHKILFDKTPVQPNDTFVRRYYTNNLMTANDYESLPTDCIGLVYSENKNFSTKLFLPLKIMKINDHYLVAGQNNLYKAECHILDSTWNITRTINLPFNAPSIANKLVTVNDTMFALCVEEGENDEINEDETQSTIVLFSLSGKIIKTRDIKTFGFNSIKKMSYDAQTHSIKYIGTTTHFRIINGLAYNARFSYDYFEDEWKLTDL